MNEIIIHEKKIPYVKKNSNPIKIYYLEKNLNDYDCISPLFDPNNKSPPTDYFINKLMLRIKNYNDFKNDFILTNK